MTAEISRDCWYRACRAGFSSTVAKEHARHHRYSPEKRPDVTVFNEGGSAEKHLLLEVRVRSPLTSRGEPAFDAGRVAPFGGLAHDVREGVKREYAEARERGHRVVPLVHDTFGALGAEFYLIILNTKKSIANTPR